MSPSVPSAPPGARRSLCIAALTLAVQNGVVMAFAVLYLPLVTEFAATRAEVAAVQSTLLLVSGFTGPVVGWGIDRLGPRRFFPVGALVAIAGLLAASRAESLWVLALTYGLIGGLGLSALGSQANMTVAALWFTQARGRAIAVVDLGTGVGAFAFIPMGQALVSTVGWRGTLVVWAALFAAVVIPANLLQRLPAPTPAPTAAGARGSDSHWTLAGAARTGGFWYLIAVRFLGATAFPIMNVHMVAFAIGAGIQPIEAATALGSVSLVSLAGRLCTGWLSDHIGRAQTLTITYASAIVGIGCLAMLALHGSPRWLPVYVLFYGFAQGSAGIVAGARTADLFAGQSFGTIYGWMSLAVGPGEALGAWLGGAIFDRTGSYLTAFGWSALLMAAGAALMWRVRQPARAA